MRGRLGGEVDEAVNEIAADDAWRVLARYRDGGRQPLVAVRFARPDQAAQPRNVLLVGDVERVEIDAGAPDDLGQCVRQWHWAVGLAVQYRSRRIRSGEGDLSGVVVAVAVGQQRQPGAGADLE